MKIFSTGSPHKLMTLKGLVEKFFEKLDEMRSEIMKKEDQFQGLMKHMTGVLCDYDKETGDMIETLHNTRNEQVYKTLYKIVKISDKERQLD